LLPIVGKWTIPSKFAIEILEQSYYTAVYNGLTCIWTYSYSSIH